MPFEFITLDADFRPVRRSCWPGADDEYDRDALPSDDEAGFPASGGNPPVSAADVLDNPELLPF